MTEKDKELSKEAIKLKGIMQKSDMFRSDMVEENIRLKSENEKISFSKKEILTAKNELINKLESEKAELERTIKDFIYHKPD